MSETLYSRLLSDDSFLLPTVNEESILAVAEMIHEQQIHPIQAIVRELAALSYQVQADYYFDKPLFNTIFEINADNVADFMAGFRTPLVIIFSCFYPNSLLFDRNVEPKHTVPYILTARSKFLNIATNCTKENIASVATTIFTYCEETPFIDNEYYRIGVTASLTTFREFIDPDELWPEEN